MRLNSLPTKSMTTSPVRRLPDMPARAGVDMARDFVSVTLLYLFFITSSLLSDFQRAASPGKRAAQYGVSFRPATLARDWFP